MWVTPEAIDAEQFTHRRLRGGYDETEVDGFLDLVACHVGEMQDYISRLEAELESLLRLRDREAELRDGGSAAGEAGPVPVQGQPVLREPLHAPPSPAVVEGPVGPYPELSPDRLDATNGGRPTNVPRPEPPSEDRYCAECGCETWTFGPDDLRSHERHCPNGPRARGLWPEPDPIASWQLPVFVPLRSLADEIAEDAEKYLHDEHRRAEARKESSTWRTAMELERAEWCRRVGLDAAPIEWTLA